LQSTARAKYDFLQNSLFFSLLAGNLAAETGSTWTASATTEAPKSPITETL